MMGSTAGTKLSPAWGKCRHEKILQGAFVRAGYTVAKPKVKQDDCLRQENIRTRVYYLAVRTKKRHIFPLHSEIKSNKITSISLNKCIFSQQILHTTSNQIFFCLFLCICKVTKHRNISLLYMQNSSYLCCIQVAS